MAFIQPSLSLQTAICAGLESEQGVPVHPTLVADTINLHTEENPVQLDARRITVQNITGSFTKSKDVIGRKLNPISFQHYLSSLADGSGAEPRWIRLMRACGHSCSSGGSAGSSSWVLDPISANIPSLTFLEYTAKTRKRVVGTIGSTVHDFPAGDPPNMTYSFLGEFQTPVSEANFPTTITRQTHACKLVENLNLVLGTYTPIAPNIRVDFARSTNERPDVNSPEGIYGLYIGDANPIVTIMLEAPEDEPAMNVEGSSSLYEMLEDGVTTDISWTHGSVAESFTTNYAFADMQLVNFQYRSENKRRMLETTWKAQNDTANAEYRIIHKEKKT